MNEHRVGRRYFESLRGVSGSVDKNEELTFVALIRLIHGGRDDYHKRSPIIRLRGQSEAQLKSRHGAAEHQQALQAVERDVL